MSACKMMVSPTSSALSTSNAKNHANRRVFMLRTMPPLTDDFKVQHGR